MVLTEGTAEMSVSTVKAGVVGLGLVGDSHVRAYQAHPKAQMPPSATSISDVQRRQPRPNSLRMLIMACIQGLEPGCAMLQISMGGFEPKIRS